MPQVAPYSGAMLLIVARSANGSAATPGPKNSTNLPTTPSLRSAWVMVRTRSVAVAPSRSLPRSRKPTTCGTSMETACPSMAASASMPPTPQPSTPRPLIIVVCESVPTSVSGYAVNSPPTSVVKTTRARYSRFTWWQIPIPGGIAEKFLKAVCPHFKNAYRSRFLWNSSSVLASKAPAVPNSST